MTSAAETSDQPPNTVIKQNPSANSKVDRGAKVTLTFSGGPGTVAVPNVGGKTPGEASPARTAAGFAPKATQVENADVEEGRVVSQSPKAGEQVAKGELPRELSEAEYEEIAKYGAAE